MNDRSNQILHFWIYNFPIAGFILDSHPSYENTCMQFVNMTQTDMSLEKILSSSGLVSMQSFRQLSRKLVWWQSTSSMFDAWKRKREKSCSLKPACLLLSPPQGSSINHSPFSGCSPWCARWAPSPQTSCSTGCSAQSWAFAVGGQRRQQTCVRVVRTESEDVLLAENFRADLWELTIWQSLRSTAGSLCYWSKHCTAAAQRVCSKTCVGTTSGTSSVLSWNMNITIRASNPISSLYSDTIMVTQK